MTVAVIGGGVAGVTAAIAAAERGQRVVVLERNHRPLKKLGVTGNGRANVLNAGVPAYYGDSAFALGVLRQVGYPALQGFFEALGVPLRQETEGRVYPAAFQATVVIEALLLRARQLGVTWMLDTRVQALTRAAQGFILKATQETRSPEARKPHKPNGVRAMPAGEARDITLRADRVIVTVGGAAAPAQGTDGTAYGLLTGFGHTLTALRPALCALLTDPRRIAGLAGQRVRAGLTLRSPMGDVLHTAQGEVLFGEDAVSGIAAMQLARFYVPGATVSLDLRAATGWEGAPDALRQPAGNIGLGGSITQGMEHLLTLAEVEQHLGLLAEKRGDCAVAEWLTGTFAAPVAKQLYREASVYDMGALVSDLRADDFKRLAQIIGAWRLPVLGTRGFDQAQVTAGGICTGEFEVETLQSKRCEGLYAAGEVLDVDGDCGGFNLMFAFASGLSAGASAGK